jgi:hypothetical protein
MQPFTYLTHAPILILNGILWFLYALLDHLWLWVVLAAGLIMGSVFDTLAIRLVRAAPSRIGGRPSPPAVSGLSFRVFTLGALGLSVAAGIVYGEPIPFLLAVVWTASVVALLLLPAEREQLLWRVKGSLVLYGLALLGFKILLSQMQSASPQEWAGIVGSVGTARDALTRTRDLFVTIGMFGVWYVIPLAHLSYLVQRVLINPLSLFYARHSAEEIIAALRRQS